MKYVISCDTEGGTFFEKASNGRLLVFKGKKIANEYLRLKYGSNTAGFIILLYRKGYGDYTEYMGL